MSHGRRMFRICVLFIFFKHTVLAQESCPLPVNRQGKCVPLKECEPYWNIFEKKLFDTEIRQYMRTSGLCRMEGNQIIVCCEQDASSCTTAENKPGACVPYRSCNPLVKYVEENIINQNIRPYLEQSRCEHSGNRNRVCCPIFQHPITGQISKKSARPKIQLPLPGEQKGTCGSQVHSTRIINGENADIYEYPWSVLLKYGNGGFSCGGSLIHPRYVLTAAHCVTGSVPASNGNVVAVRLGENNLSTATECKEPGDCNDPPVDLDVEEIVPHPSFSPQFEHDIALIRLKTPAPYTDFIRPVCLQPRNVPTPNNLTVVGWGQTKYQFMSDQKLYLNVPLVDFNECREKYSSSSIKVGRGNFCAGGEDEKDACRGDSGGPLLFYIKKFASDTIFYQTGIVSVGVRDCGTQTPTLYTKITEYLQWIEDNAYE